MVLGVPAFQVSPPLGIFTSNLFKVKGAVVSLTSAFLLETILTCAWLE